MIPALSNTNINSYFKFALDVPSLEEEQERRLIKEYQTTKNKQAQELLVNSHLKMVISIAKKNSAYGIPVEDLIQEGTIGLLMAIENFDLTSPNRLCGYAPIYVKNNIYHYAMKNYRMMNIVTTKNQRKAFYNIRKHKKSSGWYTNEEVSELSKKLNIPEKDIRDMEIKMSGAAVSFDGIEQNDDEEGFDASPDGFLHKVSDQPDNMIEEQQNENEFQKKLDKIYEIVDGFDEQNQYIFHSRFPEKTKTLTELGEMFGSTYESIRQREARMIGRIKRTLET